MSLSRRALLGGGIASVIGTATLTEALRPLANGAEHGADPGPGRPATVVQIIAHPDDDLYFMNPDVSCTLGTDAALTTVILTSGESNGVNGNGGPGRPSPSEGHDRFARARQNGLRAAYAHMATGDHGSRWNSVVLPTAGGFPVQCDTLLARPSLQLIWCQLREARKVSEEVPASLAGLWRGRIGRLESLRARGSVVGEDFTVSADQLTAALTGLLRVTAPTHVRFQDPTPDRRPGRTAYSDHQDHMYGARFVQLALERYAAEDPAHFSAQSYLGYRGGTLPPTLSPAAAEAKARTLHIYGGVGVTCGDRDGCGDYKTGATPDPRWLPAMRDPREMGTDWLHRLDDGGMLACAVLSGRLAVWRRAAGETDWPEPELLPGAGIDDGVVVVRHPDGRPAVYGTRTVGGAPGDAGYRREVVRSVDLGEWEPLGAPNGTDHEASWQLSVPVVGVDAAGRVVVAVRNAGHGLSARTLDPATGRWSGWTDLGGANAGSRPVAAAGGDGRIRILVATHDKVLLWRQRADGGFGAPVDAGLPAVTGPLTARRAGAGVTLYFRQPGTGVLQTAVVDGVEGAEPRVTSMAGGVGSGPVAEAGGALIAVRDEAGRVAVAVSPAPWVTDPHLAVGNPAAAVTADGRVTVVHLGPDARLRSLDFDTGGQGRGERG
ncbi:PIG-L family deacetylase [Streptomyces sp. NPDC059853]|uniref:PIG-L family deacetylase n=1 Tax=Streptomyces sp. NPDC059853 TaxID=3346973 RepID=UPI0036494460